MSVPSLTCGGDRSVSCGAQSVDKVIRWVILLAGLIATELLVGCAASPQSLGITGPGDQQKLPGVRHGTKAQQNLPYSGAFSDSQEG